MKKTHRRLAFLTGAITALAASALAIAQNASENGLGTLSAEELAAEPPSASEPAIDPLDRPVAAADADKVTIAPLAENGGYFDEQGRYVVDLITQDYTYIAIRLVTPNGRPVMDATPEFSIKGSSQLLKPKDVQMPSASDKYGIVEFAVVAGQMGLDTITVNYEETSTQILVNVLSQLANQHTMPELGKDFVSWNDLLQTRVQYKGIMLFADFPEALAARSGETVKLWGFMMPLEAGAKQRNFLLTAQPPGCFFHTPGGPAGAIEVFAKEGIEVSWDPIVLEGQFKALEESSGAIFQLNDARVVEQ
ncbi:MAG: hypothetical protein AAF385_12450 [Pseudomonadota bacterium]